MPPPIQLILSLEKRLTSLDGTLQVVRDDLLRRSAEVETLQRTVAEKVRQMGVGGNSGEIVAPTEEKLPAARSPRLVSRGEKKNRTRR